MLLNISKLNLWFNTSGLRGDQGSQQVLHDVSLRIDSGGTTAIVGESGSGKSVTALSVLRLLEQSSNITTTGSIRFNGHELLDIPLESMRELRGNKIGMIFQEPMTSLNPVYSVGDQLLEPFLSHRGLGRHEAEKEAIKLLARTQIDNPEVRMKMFPHQLSGGQRQRVMIAMALACNPQLLIADEPTTALDVTVQREIMNLLEDIRDEYGMAVLLISHDLPLVKQICSDVYIMKDGRVVESGVMDEVFTKPKDVYTAKLINSIPAEKKSHFKGGPVILTTKDLQCEFATGSGILSFLGKKQRAFTAVNSVNLKLQAGATYGIIGESGSGKTSLAMAILRLINSSGEIIFNRQNLQLLTSSTMKHLRSEMQVVFQDPFSSLSPRLSAFQIIEEGLKIHRKELSASQRAELVHSAMEEVGLQADMALRYPHEFSGGQRQRIAIARVLVLKPQMLILDEPTSALDATIQSQVIDLLIALQKKYQMTYLFISHDLKVIRAMADYVIIMRQGKIVETGPAREIFANPGQDYTKQLFQASLN